MATAPTVTGNGPLSFTDSNGSQRSVPLSGLAYSDSTIGLDTDYAAHFSPADATTVQTLAANLAAAGVLTPSATAPPVPAIMFTAANPGPEGNNITVTLAGVTFAAGTSTVLSASIGMAAIEVDVYAGLADGPAAQAAIGVDVPGKTGDRLGTGLVQIQETGTPPPSLTAQAVAKQAVAGPTNILAADGKTTLFTLIPRASAIAAGVKITVSVALDPPPATTFTLTVTGDAGASKQVAMTALATGLPGGVASLVSATTPSQLALPAEGLVTLSGGAVGVAATGTAYTS